MGVHDSIQERRQTSDDSPHRRATSALLAALSQGVGYPGIIRRLSAVHTERVDVVCGAVSAPRALDPHRAAVVSFSAALGRWIVATWSDGDAVASGDPGALYPDLRGLSRALNQSIYVPVRPAVGV